MKYAPHKPKRYTIRFDTKTFMAEVTARRDARGLTWVDLGLATGIHNATLQHLATGRVDAPGAHILCNLLKWLGKTDIAEYMIEVDPEAD